MKYLLFLVLLASCATQKLIIREELPDRIIYKIPGRWVWGNIMKDSLYQNYFPYNYGRRLAPGDLIIFDWKKYRVKEVAVPPMCGCNTYDWLYLNYPDTTGGFKCNCK